MHLEGIFTRTPFSFRCFASLILALLVAGPAPAATITVNETTDEFNSDGDCSLREAVVSANRDSSEDACNTGSGADVILLPRGTYELTVTNNNDNGDGTVNDLDLTGETTIRPDNAGADPYTRVIRPADPQAFDDSAFFVNGDSELRHITIQGFSNSLSGGGIYQSAPLTLASVVLRNNTAGGNGGGLYQNRDPLVIERSAFIGNTAENGGAFFLRRDHVQIRDSTFVRNYTADYTNTGSSGKNGGAIVLAPNNAPVSTSHLDNLTVVRNSAADAGGGLHVSADANFALRNSIIADNRAANVNRACDIASGATIASDTGYNLTGSTKPCSAVTGPNSITGADPHLARSGVYDGNTDSAPPRSPSPAIDAGDCTDSQSNSIKSRADQRKGSRTRNADGDGDGTAGCDMGAIERQKTALVVNSTGDTRDQNPGDGTCLDGNGNCTLRAALDEANADADLDEIILPPKHIRLTRGGQGDDNNATGDLDVTETVIINGAGAGRTSVDADGLDRVFHKPFTRSVTMALRGLTVTGGKIANPGGGIYGGSAELLLTEVRVTANKAKDNPSGGGNSGGGISVGGGDLRMVRSTVDDNESGQQGGGIDVHSTDNLQVIRNSTITGNSSGFGGGVAADDARLHVEHSTVVGNTAANGPGLHDRDKGWTRVHASIVGGCSSFNGGSIDSLGYNLETGTNCGFTAGTDKQNANPGLATLADVGAVVPLREPYSGSTAVDSGTCRDTLIGRLPQAPFGGTRPQDADVTNSGMGDGIYDCDIGAAERQQVRVRPGGNMPAARTISPGRTDMVMAQFELENESGENLDGLEFTLRGTGSGDEAADIKAVRLYLDTNGDGQLDGGDTQVGKARTFNADDGTVTFDLSGTASPLMASGNQVEFLVTYDFASQLALRDPSVQSGLAWAVTLPFGLLPLLGFATVRQRLLAGLAVILLAVTLAGCGGGNGSLDVAALALILNEDEDDDARTEPRSETYAVVTEGLRVEGTTGGRLTIRTPAVSSASLTVEE